MRTTGKRQAIRNALFRLGLQTPPKVVVHALAQQGVQVSEELVRQVRVELLKEATRATAVRVPRPVPLPAVRRCPQGFPGRRGTG
jgi:hypothetical protein